MELKYKAIACFLIGIFSLSGCTSTEHQSGYNN